MKAYAENKKARFNYEILEEYEAGIILTGPEVKSVRLGQITIREAFATISRGELWLTNAHVSPYKQARDQEQEPTRPRKLLMSRAEISKMIGKSQTEGLTLVPLRVYDKHGKIKVEIGLAKGKKKYDKRELIKNRDLSRDAARELREKK